MKTMILSAFLLTGAGALSSNAQQFSVDFSAANRNGYIAGSYAQPGPGRYDSGYGSGVGSYDWYRYGQHEALHQELRDNHHQLHRDLRAERSALNRQIEDQHDGLHHQLRSARRAGVPRYVIEAQHRAAHRELQQAKRAGRDAIRYGHAVADDTLRDAHDAGHYHLDW